MVGVFRRSVSFHTINQSRPSKTPIISHHTRSISLPCRSHPLITLLRDQISELRIWTVDESSRGSAWLVNGLTRLKNLHDSLDDALQLPQTQESLRRQKSHVVENLLEAFLRFVDAFGIFQTSIMAHREEHSSAEVAIRKRDESKMILYVKARKRMAKEMQKLVSVVEIVTDDGSTGSPAVVCVGDAEIVGVVNDAVEVTVAVSLAVFNGIAASLAGRRGCSSNSTWLRLGFGKRSAKFEESVIGEFAEVDLRECLALKKKSDEEIRKVARKMRDLEGCLRGIETHGQRVFRGLISARVSLLNALTE